MVSLKRPRHDENTLFSFVDQSTPATKQPWLKGQPITLAEIKNLLQEQAQKDQAAAEVRAQVEAKAQVEQVLSSITAVDDELHNICDQQLSSCVSNMFSQEAILDSIQAYQPDLVKQWAARISGELLAEEHPRLSILYYVSSCVTKELPKKDKVQKDCSLGSSISFILY